MFSIWPTFAKDTMLLFFLASTDAECCQYNYYVAELAFYWSLMFSQFTDIKRKVSQVTGLEGHGGWTCSGVGGH